MKKMQAAQIDSRGGRMINVDAEVAQISAQDVLTGSDLLFAQSLRVFVGDHRPHFETGREPCRIWKRLKGSSTDRRERVIHAVGRMNGARAIPESLAQRRLFLSQPARDGRAQPTRDELRSRCTRRICCRSRRPGAARCNRRSCLLETPYRQLIPFSPYDSSMGDANMLFMAKSGGGKTFMAQMFLLMMARSNPLISIVERGDSYRPLVELMGGRVIEVDLEGSETLNPWDLPPGDISADQGQDRVPEESHAAHDRGSWAGRHIAARQHSYVGDRRGLQARRDSRRQHDADVLGPEGRAWQLE